MKKLISFYQVLRSSHLVNWSTSERHRDHLTWPTGQLLSGTESISPGKLITFCQVQRSSYRPDQLESGTEIISPGQLVSFYQVQRSFSRPTDQLFSYIDHLAWPTDKLLPGTEIIPPYQLINCSATMIMSPDQLISFYQIQRSSYLTDWAASIRYWDHLNTDELITGLTRYWNLLISDQLSNLYQVLRSPHLTN